MSFQRCFFTAIWKRVLVQIQLLVLNSLARHRAPNFMSIFLYNRTCCKTKVFKTKRKWPIQLRQILGNLAIKLARANVNTSFSPASCMLLKFAFYSVVPRGREGSISSTNETSKQIEEEAVKAVGVKIMDQPLNTWFILHRRLKEKVNIKAFKLWEIARVHSEWVAVYLLKRRKRIVI